MLGLRDQQAETWLAKDSRDSTVLLVVPLRSRYRRCVVQTKAPLVAQTLALCRLAALLEDWHPFSGADCFLALGWPLCVEEESVLSHARESCLEELYWSHARGMAIWGRIRAL